MAIDAYGWAHKLSPEALDVMDALYQLYRETKQGAKAAEIVEKLLQSPEMKAKPEKAKRIYYALYPHTRHVAPKVRAFVDYMREHYRAQ